MPDQPVIEIREPGEAVRRVVLDHAIEVGRRLRRRGRVRPGRLAPHVKLVPNPTSLSVVDLGSRNGTLVNGNPLSGRASLQAGDIVRVGSTDIVVVSRPVAPGPVIPARATVTARPVEEVPVPKPPPPAPVVEEPSWPREWLDRALGITTRRGQPVFPNYMEIRRHIPIRVWHVVRVVSVCAYIALCVALFVRPAGGLFWFFKVVVPLLPITFFVAPGLWRNVCPLAASNQAPARARLHARLHTSSMAAQLRLCRCHCAVLWYHQCPPCGFQCGRPGHGSLALADHTQRICRPVCTSKAKAAGAAVFALCSLCSEFMGRRRS